MEVPSPTVKNLTHVIPNIFPYLDHLYGCPTVSLPGHFPGGQPFLPHLGSNTLCWALTHLRRHLPPPVGGTMEAPLTVPGRHHSAWFLLKSLWRIVQEVEKRRKMKKKRIKLSSLFCLCGQLLDPLSFTITLRASMVCHHFLLNCEMAWITRHNGHRRMQGH